VGTISDTVTGTGSGTATATGDQSGTGTVTGVGTAPATGAGSGTDPATGATGAQPSVAPYAGDSDAPVLLLLDGHSLAYRAFFALPADRFSTTTGQATNAVYGFTSMLINLLRDERPTHIAVAFDVSRKTWRSAEYPEYKAQRSTSPAEFGGQVELLKEVLAALRIPTLAVDEYEADDVIATLTTQARAGGMAVRICTGDRDALQLVDEAVTVLYPVKGVSELTRFTPETVQEKYGLSPAQYPDFAALRGDPSDNLPGVHGVGGTIAARLMTAFGTAAALYQALDGDGEAEIRRAAGRRVPAQLRAAAARENVVRNQRLMTMRTDVPMPGLDAMRVPLDRQILRAALSARGINLGPSLWALTGGTRPPDPEAMAALSMFAPVKKARKPVRAPGEGQLALF